MLPHLGPALHHSKAGLGSLVGSEATPKIIRDANPHRMQDATCCPEPKPHELNPHMEQAMGLQRLTKANILGK